MSYHPKIVAQFGEDLFALLGPKANRVPWSSLSYEEQQSRLDRIPEYVNTRTLGKRPSMVDIVIYCFNRLVNMGADNPLLGIDLPSYNSLNDAAEKLKMPALNYDPTNLHDLMKLVKNAAKQRDVFLKHIFEDVVFRFNPGLVFPGVGRMDSQGWLYVNDGQHRILACIILGIENVPISYSKSDDEYWDVSQYAAINIHSLSASEFDKYRIRVQRYLASIEAGIATEEEDHISYELHELFEDLEITVAEKSDKSLGKNGKVLTGIGNMIKYRKEYGEDRFQRATTINARLFPTCVFQTANSWGLMEFLKAQKGLKVDSMQVDYAIFNALRKRWARDNAGKYLQKDIKDAYKEQTDSDATNSRIPEPVIIAHGIWQVCKKYAPEIDWVEPDWPEKTQKFTLELV
jgi:hypothetical protein